MGQRLGRHQNRGGNISLNNSPPEENFERISSLQKLNISKENFLNQNLNKSVIITIRMLKMEPTEQKNMFCGCNQKNCYHFNINDNNNMMVQSTTSSSNSICDNNKQQISKNNHQVSPSNHHINDFSNNIETPVSAKLGNNNFNIINQLGNNMNLTPSSSTLSSNSSLLFNNENENDLRILNKIPNLKIMDDELSLNCLRLGLGSSGGQLIKQSNNYDQHKLNGNNINNIASCLNNLSSCNLNNSSNEYLTNKELNVKQKNNFISATNNSEALLPSSSCDNCRHKSKGKLCKICRSNENETVDINKKTKENSKSKKGNWGIGRFKRNSNKAVNNNTTKSTLVNQQTSESALKVTNEKTNKCVCSSTNSLETLMPDSNENFTLSSTNNSDQQYVDMKPSNPNTSSSPHQLRAAALQFYPPTNNLVMASSSNPVENFNNTSSQLSISNNNLPTSMTSSSILPQNGSALLHSNNQILQRAAFYNGNVGGNVIVLSMNQAQPLLDFTRFNPEDYPIEDCDERARLQRAVEIAEGVEPPPGFRPKTQPPAPQNTQPPPQWHMLCAPDTALQNLLNNTFVFPNNVFLSSEEIPRIHSQVDYIHCLVPDLQKITSCSFYWGKMDRYEAERLLEGKPEGTFLLRDSAQEEFLFSVSFRKYSRSLHARIEQFNHKFSFDSHDPGVYTASTVTGLLEHYKDPSCVMFFEPMLTIPLNRNFPFSLQQLCRATIVSHSTYDSINDFSLPVALKSYLKEYHYKQRVRVRRFDEHTYVNS